MVPAEPHLGPRAQPADGPLWGTADTISEKRESLEQGTRKVRLPQPYSVDIYSIFGNHNLIIRENIQPLFESRL